MKSIMIEVGGTDWKLLREQKLKLISMRLSIRPPNDTVDVLDGIVNLIDNIQDQAAEQIGENKVFGRLK